MSKRKFDHCSPDQGGVASTPTAVAKMASVGGGYFIKGADRSSLRKLAAFKKTRDITGQTDILKETKVKAPIKDINNLFNKLPDVSSGGRFFKLFV